MRYFELKPFNLIYFESEELRHLPRKEFQITVESKVVAVYKSDNTSRYSFKVSNQWDVLTLAAGTETERDNWIQNISLAISYITNCMFGYMVLIRPLLKNHRDKYYFIFGNGLISMHAGERQTSEVDGTFRFSNETVLDEVDDYNKIITLSDHSSSTSDLKTISFVFSYSDPNSKMHPSQLYKIWKTAIIRAMRPDALKKSVKNVRKDRDINGASIKLPSTGTAVGSKMNALEVVSNRRLSMNNMKAIVETHHDDDDNDDDDNGGDVDDDNFNAGLERPSFLALPPPPLPPHLTSRPLPTLPPPSNSISTPPLPRTTPTISSPPVKPSTDNTIHQSLRRDDDVSNPPPLPPPMSPITTPLMSVPHLPTDSNTASRPPPPRPPSVIAPLSTISSPPPQSSSSTPSIPRPLPPQPPSVIPTPPPPPPLLSTNHLHLSNNDSTNNPPRPLPPALPMVAASSHQSTDSTTSPRPPPPPPPISRQPPPSALSSLSSSSTPFTSPQLHNDRPPPPTASPLRVIPSASTDNDDDDIHASERNTNLSIDAYYDGKQNSTSDSFKGEMMTNESRANLKLQLARLKESNEQSSYIAANTTVSSPVAKAEVNPLLHSFQAQSNPLTRQRSPVGKTDASPNATSTD